MSRLVVLHISDLHFGIENDRTEKTKYVRLRQKEMLISLIDTIKDVVKESPEWKPDVIAISGDIAWSGQKEEYELYKDVFVNSVAEELNIAPEYIITCPGNHDIMREKVNGLNRPVPNIKDPDVVELDSNEILEQASHFEGYVDIMCDGNPEKLCQIITYDKWPWVSFLTLNSAWDCRNDQDEERLRVGLPILEKLIEKIPDKNYVITLFHHPHTEVEDFIEQVDSISHQKVLRTKKRNWLHITEREPEYAGARCFTTYVESKSTFILNGHIHKETEPQKLNKSIQLISGTLYSNDTPRYHCRLLQLKNNQEPLYRDLRHAIGDADQNWEVTIPKKFQFEHIAILISRRNEQEEKEKAFGTRLKEAQEMFDKGGDIEQYKKAVHEVASELLHEVIEPANSYEKNNIIDSEKVSALEQIDVLTLKNGGIK